MKSDAEKRAYDRKRYAETNGALLKRIWREDPENRLRDRQAGRRHRQKIRTKVLALYGNSCACCQERHQEFLSLDHINGGGLRHRQTIRKHVDSTAFYKAVLKEGYRPDKYRILCHNCNQSLGHYGYCPHQEHAIVSDSDPGKLPFPANVAS